MRSYTGSTGVLHLRQTSGVVGLEVGVIALGISSVPLLLSRLAPPYAQRARNLFYTLTHLTQQMVREFNRNVRSLGI